MTAKGHIEIPTSLVEALRAANHGTVVLRVWNGNRARDVVDRFSKMSLRGNLEDKVVEWAKRYIDGGEVEIDVEDMELRREEQSGYYQLVEVD